MGAGGSDHSEPKSIGGNDIFDCGTFTEEEGVRSLAGWGYWGGD